MLTGIKSSDFNKSFGEDTVQLRATSCFSKKKKKTWYNDSKICARLSLMTPSLLYSPTVSEVLSSFSPDLWAPSPPLLHQLAPLSITLSEIHFSSRISLLYSANICKFSHPLKHLYCESVCHVESAFAMTITLLLFGVRVYGKLIKPIKLTLSACLPHALTSQGIAEWKGTVCPWHWGHSCEPDKCSPWFHEEKTDTK